MEIFAALNCCLGHHTTSLVDLRRPQDFADPPDQLPVSCPTLQHVNIPAMLSNKAAGCHEIEGTGCNYRIQTSAVTPVVMILRNGV